MPRRYKGDGHRILKCHSAEAMLRALILHRQGTSIRKAAKECRLKYSTLSRYVKKYANISIEELKNQRLTPNYDVNKIFTAQQEAELTAFIIECSKTKPPTAKEVRKAAYEMAAVNDIEMPENWKREQMAGLEWQRAFKLRNFGPDKPEDPAVNVSAMEEVVKELIDGNKVCGSERNLSTLRVKDKGMIMPDSNSEHDPNALMKKLEKPSTDLCTDGQKMIEVHTNLSDSMLDLDCKAGDVAIDQDKREKIDVEIEIEPESADESSSLNPLSDKEDAEDEASTNVWSYYEREAGARARCVVCRAVVDRTDLKTHLTVHHPKLVAEVDLGSDEDASDSQEDVYTEIVYLEEEQTAKKHKSTPKSKLKPFVERPEPRKRQASSSSDDAPLRRKNTKKDDKQQENNDEIEQFGKYVTCLLKKIPAAACMELQAEIINLIMKKQLELKRNETSILAGNKMAETAGRATFESTPSTSSFNISNGATE